VSSEMEWLTQYPSRTRFLCQHSEQIPVKWFLNVRR